MVDHTIKVEPHESFRKHPNKAQIRLKGKWIMEAGLQPDSYVTVSNPEPGTLIIKTKEVLNDLAH